MFNLSAPFLMQVPPFKTAMMEVLPYVDVLFGNESEAVTFAETEGWETRDVAEIAMKISKMPKASGHRARVVVFTQGMDDTIVAKEGKISKYPVIALAKEDLVDTNGVGDAFVKGSSRSSSPARTSPSACAATTAPTPSSSSRGASARACSFQWC